MPILSKTERNEAVKFDRNNGMSLGELSLKYGVTIPRIREIILGNRNHRKPGSINAPQQRPIKRDWLVLAGVSKTKDWLMGMY